MNEKLLEYMSAPPELYAPSTAPFWDDEHISAQMLAAHLDPERDAASRRHSFIRASAQWIAGLSCRGKALLDLGCGPGLYAERFAELGCRVAGIDISRRSINYAKEHALKAGLDIDYTRGSYLEMEHENSFDIITLIYCDFGVLPPNERALLLGKVRRALRPGGVFVVDAFTPAAIAGFEEGRSVQYSKSGFWSAKPNVCITTRRLYRETDNYLEQYIVLTEGGCECYNIWNQVYTPKTLEAELAAAGFGRVELFGDAAGAPFTADPTTLCAVARVE